MPQFKYRAKDKNGESVIGQVSVPSREDLVRQLHKKNLVLISVDELSPTKKPVRKKFARNAPVGKGVATLELIIFCRQLSTMLAGGVPILNAIESIAGEIKNKGFQSTLFAVATNVRRGYKLSASFKRFPNTFSILFCISSNFLNTSASIS